MPDVPRTLYAACPSVKVPFVRAFVDRGHAERATQPDHDWQVVPYHHLPMSGPERDEIQAVIEKKIAPMMDRHSASVFARAVYDALLQHYNQETP